MFSPKTEKSLRTLFDLHEGHEDFRADDRCRISKRWSHFPQRYSKVGTS